MALLTIVEASKQFKIARSRLYKKINEGELSTQLNESGSKVIQYVDLVRVFGENNLNTSRTSEDSTQVVLEDNKGQPLRTDKDIIDLLKEQVSELKKDKAEMARRLDDMSSKHDKLLLLIEHKAFSSQDNEDSTQIVLEDNKGQLLRIGEDKQKTNSVLITIGVLIIILLIALIVMFSLKFSGVI